LGCSANIERFDGSRSSTFENLTTPFSVTYGSGAASGYLVSDVVQMAGFQVSSQTFGKSVLSFAVLIDSYRMV